MKIRRTEVAVWQVKQCFTIVYRSGKLAGATFKSSTTTQPRECFLTITCASAPGHRAPPARELLRKCALTRVQVWTPELCDVTKSTDRSLWVSTTPSPVRWFRPLRPGCFGLFETSVRRSPSQPDGHWCVSALPGSSPTQTCTASCWAARSMLVASYQRNSSHSHERSC